MYFVDFKHGEVLLETVSISDVHEPMWLHAGFDLLDYQGHDIEETIPALNSAIRTLEDSPDHYQLYEEGYGGNLGTVLEFLEYLRETALDYEGSGVTLDVRY